MLDIKKIRENPQLIKENLKKRIDYNTEIVDELLTLDSKFREMKTKTDSLRAEKNKKSKSISEIKKKGGEIKEILEEVSNLSKELSKLEEELIKTENERENLLLSIPNLLDEEVPIGKDDSENKILEIIGEKPKFDFKPRDHKEICEMNDWYELEIASKVSGARFYYLKKEALLLQIALYNYVINKMNEKGYIPIETPPMLRRESIGKSVSLADFEEVIYKIEDEDLYLIGTSEHALALLHDNQTLNYKELPLKYVGLSPCFRKEAGVTKDSKGIFRVHNFNKIEQFIFCPEQDSEKLHLEILENAKEIFKELEIHYQVIDICSGDIGSFASRKFDIEAYLPGQDAYREMVSASNYRDFGARRLETKYQDKNGELKFVHTLNSTAIALTRCIIAIIETHQNEDGNVRIPKVLRPYLQGREFLIKK